MPRISYSPRIRFSFLLIVKQGEGGREGDRLITDNAKVQKSKRYMAI